MKIQKSIRQPADKNQNHFNKGIGTIEVLISLMVIVSAITAVMLVVAGNQDIKLDDDVSNVALYRAGEIISKARTAGEVDFNSVVSSSSLNSIFTDSLKVSDISACRKDITASISWEIRPGRYQNVSLTSSLVSHEEAQALGLDCELSPPVGEWQIECPPQYGYDFNPGGLSASGIDFFRKGNDKYVAMTSNKGSSEKDDFWIIEVTDKTAITKISSINVSDALNDVDGFGDYAFVANDEATNQLIVIDMSDLYNPVDVASVSLPGVGGAEPEGRQIYYYDNKVYIGTRLTAGPEFHIFDVSDPTNPVHLGSRELNHSVRKIIVRDSYAYLATSGNSDELIILDVSNPASILPFFPGVGNPEAMNYDAPGNQDGMSLYLLSNKLYLGRERGTGANHDFLVLDVQDPNNVTLLGSTLLNLNPNTAVTGIIVSGDLAFVVTSDQGEGFMILDIEDSQNIIKLDSCNYSEKAIDIDFDGEYSYAANESNSGLRIINKVTAP